MSPLARRVLSVLGTAVLLGAVAWQIDLPAAASLLRGADLGLFLLAAALGPVQIGLSALRWQRVARALGPAPPLRAAAAEYAVSTLLNQLLPGGVSGDVVRAWRHHRRWGAAGRDAAMAAVIERGAGQAVLLVVVLLGVLSWPLLHPGAPRPSGVLPLVLGLSVAGMLALAAPASVRWIGPPAAAARRAVRGPVLPLSVVITATYIAGFALCAAALGLSAGAAVLTAIPLVLLAMALPISVGGWGLREAAAAALLPPLGWSAEAAVATSALYGLSALLGASPGALALLQREDQ